MQEPRPGEWPDISGPYYQYLLRLARRRLIGAEHHAEDVVDRAMERWVKIPRDHPSARIETLIGSEALSLLRSETRRRHREERVAIDAATRAAGSTGDEASLRLLRWELVRTCERDGITMSTTDVEVLELLLSGHNLAETARAMGVTRQAIKASRRRWQWVVQNTRIDRAVN